MTSSWLIAGGIILALGGALLIWWGVRSGSVKRALAGIAAAVTGVLSFLLGRADKRIRKQEQELEVKTAQLKEAAEKVREVEDVQAEINEVRQSSEKPEAVPPPAPGDSAARLDRLNRL